MKCATLKELAELVGGTLRGDGLLKITGVASLEDARGGDISFVSSPRYRKLAATTEASALVVSPQLADTVKDKPLIVAEDPYRAFAKIIAYFVPLRHPFSGISKEAFIDPSATIADGVTIGAGVFVAAGAQIGSRTVLYPGVFVGEDVVIGEDTLIYSNVSIREGSKIGSRVVIHCNSVVGSDGFGYIPDGRKHMKIPQVGNVVIEDDVEIGACVTIDRATTGTTLIGRGTKIDNLVQIGHNVKVGHNTIIVAQNAIAGSVRVGNNVTLAGQVGIVGHIDIADGTVVGAKSLVTSAIKDGGNYTGYPAIEHKRWLRAQAIVSKLPELNERLKELEQKVKRLEKK